VLLRPLTRQGVSAAESGRAGKESPTAALGWQVAPRGFDASKATLKTMVNDSAICFTISSEGDKCGPPKSFRLTPGENVSIRIGRAPLNDIVVAHRGVSQYHAEVKLMEREGDGPARLCVRDLSMNGTGLKKSDAKGAAAVCLAKNADEPLPDGALVLVPYMLKENQTENDRAWLKVTLTDGAEAKPAATEGSEGDQDQDEVAEKKRMAFVDLLLKSKEVSAGTKYEQAMQLLGTSPAWTAVEEQTRKECFDIFVEHLGSHQSHKEKKKDKTKAKKHKSHKEEAEKEAASPESPDRARRKEKDKDKKGKEKRDKKGDAGSRSRSRGKKRRRGRSASS